MNVTFGFRDERLNNFEIVEKLIKKFNMTKPRLEVGREDDYEYDHYLILYLSEKTNNIKLSMSIEECFDAYKQDGYRFWVIMKDSNTNKTIKHKSIYGLENILNYIES